MSGSIEPTLGICASAITGIIAHATRTHTITVIRLLQCFILGIPPVRRTVPPGTRTQMKTGLETASRQGGTQSARRAFSLSAIRVILG